MGGDSKSPRIWGHIAGMRFLNRNRTLPEDAAAVLYETYYDHVLRQVVAVTGNPECAVDSTQEAFLRAFERFDSLKDRTRFSSWVTSIALNVARDTLRKRQRESPAGDGEVVNRQNTRLDHKGVEEEASLREDVRLLQDAISAMPEDLRSVVMLFYMQGLDTKAVSETLGIPVGTVKSRLSRAREQLRRSIGYSP